MLELQDLDSQVASKIFVEINKILDEAGGGFQKNREALMFFCLLQLFKNYFPNPDVILDPTSSPERLMELRKYYMRW
jgi:hypothetical protein